MNEDFFSDRKFVSTEGTKEMCIRYPTKRGYQRRSTWVCGDGVLGRLRCSRGYYSPGGLPGTSLSTWQKGTFVDSLVLRKITQNELDLSCPIGPFHFPFSYLE